MKSHHSPGPWRTEKHSYGHIVLSGAGLPVAIVDDETVPPREARSNTSLIAAAPELFTALTDLLAVMGGDADEEYPLATARARAAIAKAAG